MISSYLLRPSVQFALATTLFSSLASLAQNTLSMQEAVQLGLEKHPDWAMAEGAIVQAEAQKSAAFQVDPTQIDFQYGQINAGDLDYNVTVQQDIGSILGHLRRGESGRALIALREAEFHLEEKKLQLLIKSAYIDWRWAYHRWQLLTEQDSIIRAFRTRVQERSEVGESRSSEVIQADSEYLDFQRLVMRARIEYLSYERALYTLIQADESYIPKTGQILIPINFIQSAQLDSALIVPLVERVNFAEAEVDVQASQFFPSFQVGYFNQMLEGVEGFQGITVGMSYPIIFNTSKADIVQARVEVDINQRQAEYTLNAYQQELKYTRESLQLQYAIARLFVDEQLENSQKLRESAEEEWENGEVEFYEFFQLFRMSVEMQVNTMDVLRETNLSTLQYQFLQQ